MPAEFAPRDWVEPVRAFYDPDVPGRWRDARDRSEADELLVAHYLSQVCREVTTVLRERGMKIVDLATILGADVRLLRRKLNGEYLATTRDVLRWAVALDHPEIVYAPGRTDDLLAGNSDLRRRLLDVREV